MRKFISLLIISVLLTGCKTSSSVQPLTSTLPVQSAPKPIQMILDTDFGSSTDDCFALMMLHHYIDEGKVDLKGVIVDREGEKNAQAVDVFDTYYGHPDIPIGLERNGVKNPRCFIPYNGICDIKDAQGQPLFKQSMAGTSFPDGYKLYRKLLSQAEDKSVVIVAIGFVTTISELFNSGADEYSQDSGLDLFEKKVKSVYIQSGRFESGDSLCGYNMRAAASQSDIFYSKLPKSVKLIMSPSNVGDAMNYAPQEVLSDLSATELNPIKAIYTYYTCDTGQRMWDTNCLVNAVFGNEEYNMSPTGWVTFVNKGQESLMLFQKDAEGNAQYQLPGDSYFAEKKLIDIRSHTRKVPNPATYTIESPQPQIIRSDAAEWAKQRMGQLVDKYVGSAGNTLDPNNIYMLFRPLGYTGLNSEDFTEANRLVTDAVYDRMLQKAIRNGKKDIVIVSGPPSSGKTTVVNKLNLKKAGLIYDADLSDGTLLADAIGKAEKAGMDKITLIQVYNDPLTCYKKSIERGNLTYRYTSLEQLVNSFRSNVNKLQGIQKQYPDVEILPYDCSGTESRQVSLKEAAKWNYSVTESQLHDLLTYLNSLINEGSLESFSILSATGNILNINTNDAQNQELAGQIDAKIQDIKKELRMRY